MSSEAGCDVRVADDILELAEECIDPQELRLITAVPAPPINGSRGTGEGGILGLAEFTTGRRGGRRADPGARG